jgi:Flp pilus assembly protein TadD
VNNFLGTMLHAAGRDAEAIEQYRRTLDLDPSLPLTVTNLAISLESIGHEKEAIEHFLKVQVLWGASAARVEELRRAYERGGRRGFRRRETTPVCCRRRLA